MRCDHGVFFNDTATTEIYTLSLHDALPILGYSIAPDGRFMPEDWWAIVFNPSFPFRYLHTITGAYLTTAMIVGAVGAWHVLKDGANARAGVMFSMAMWMAAAGGPAQAFFGGIQGLLGPHHQPPKGAAIE